MTEWNSPLPYVVAHTSGSTGMPKEIRLLKSDMRSSARATNAFFGIDGGSVLALPLSLDYIAGKMMAVRAIEAGCRLDVMKPSNDVSLAGPTDLLAVVPTQLPSLMAQENSPSMIRHLLIGGAPLSDDAERAVASRFSSAWLGYGMTETCSHVALRRVGDDGVFAAMPGITFSVDSESCLRIESARFSWQQLQTNDVAELLDPTHFRWIGRRDNVVNSGGVKLHPELLEADYLRRIPSLPPFYLCGEDDPVLGQRLVMVVENPPADLMDTLRAAIPDHKHLPKRIIPVPSLPRTPSGKIKRVRR